MIGSYSRKYFKAVKSLYSEERCAETLDLFDGKVDGGREISSNVDVPTEFQEHIRVVSWLMKNNIDFYHVPNGGYRKKEEAYKLKAMGVFSGVPDLCILGARRGYHGLYLEIKRKVGGKLSDTQKYWAEVIMKHGYLWKEGKGADECIRIVREYFGI